jgi:hypothetical protein
MEIPYRGRAVINESYDGADIVIPVKKNWFLIVFSSVWLCLWIAAGIFIPVMLIGTGAAGARMFMYLFLSGWAIHGFFSAGRWWWSVAGKEMIHISPGLLTISRKGNMFKRTKSYDLSLCGNFRAVEEQMPIYHYYNQTAGMLRRKPRAGTIKFDYDVVDVIQFGDWLSEAEGSYILDKLRAKKLIK